MVDNSNDSLYSDFEYYSRKSKGRRKSKQKSNLKRNVVETSDGSETSVTNTDEESTKMNNVIEGTPVENDVKYWTSELTCGSVSSDAFLNKEPSYPPEVSVTGEQPFEHISHSLDEGTRNELKGSETPSVDVEENEQIIYNHRALEKYDLTYKLETFEKNALLIFNQENIDGYVPRLGTTRDVQALKNTFETLGFEVTEHKDLTKKQIIDTLKAFCAQDFTDYGCIGIAVLTHGMQNGLLRAKDMPYSEVEIIDFFKVHNKPTLVTKPKLLIIQACRGPKTFDGARVLSLPSKIKADLDSAKEPYIIPVQADMLVLHSSFYESPSYRNEEYGSWFIQALCTKISEFSATLDFVSIVLEVTRDVAFEKQYEEYNRRTLQMQINKQVPVMTSTLLRKLYLKKFGAPPLTIADNGQCVCQKAIRQNSTSLLESDPAPTAPLLVQLGPCFCFLEHFDYIKKCLRHFVDENPEDNVAHSYLDVAEAFEDGDNFNAAKQKFTVTMSNHLRCYAKNCYFYKYLFLKKT